MGLTSLESQGLASNKHDIGTLVSTIHLIFPLAALVLPRCAGRIVQTGSFIGPAANVSGADDTVSVTDCEIEQTPSVHVLIVQDLIWDLRDEVVDLLDCGQHCLTQNTWSKSVWWWGAWVVS